MCRTVAHARHGRTATYYLGSIPELGSHVQRTGQALVAELRSALGPSLPPTHPSGSPLTWIHADPEFSPHVLQSGAL